MAGKEVVVIGAGFGGMAAAGLLARKGFDVTVLEKNSQPGGRGQVWKKDGFLYDMGPSWYLMPEVFERFFSHFGRKPEELYTLQRLDPHYRVFFGSGKKMDVLSDLKDNYKLFESMEKGGSDGLKRYLESASYQYKVAMEQFIYKEYRTIFDFMNRKLVFEGTKLHIFESLDRYAKRFIKDKDLRKILEYNIVFLGGTPNDSPALYALMSHVDFNLGVWYPMGGFGELARAFMNVAKDAGVKFVFDAPAERILVENGKASGVRAKGRNYRADSVVVNADYAWAEMNLLDENSRTYNERYWKKKAIAPSCLLMYIGLDKRMEGLNHHNLFLSSNWDEHFDTIFKRPRWPDDPSYYVCCPSKTDPSVAPEGCENLFFLVPVAPGLADDEQIRDKYYDKILTHLEKLTGERIREHVIVKRIFAHSDFTSEYNAYKGTALGLAHTLMQTAVFRPSHYSKKVKGLYYTGHYTHPGIGVPMVVISSEILAEEIAKG
ncbi:MAG: phytoene desaturase family protein [Candidatus Thermoplasmatota archaeon]|nr:phytoene desaturase family protein [Candidatus Thermoplasmatota archaeon]